MPLLPLESTEPWAPHPAAAPRNGNGSDDLYTSTANGTRTCTGGWQFVFTGISAGQCLSIRLDAEYAGLAAPRDATLCTAYWGRIAPDSSSPSPLLERDYLLPESVDPSSMRFSRVLRVPEHSDALTVRCTLRWVAGGEVRWHVPEVEIVDRPGPEPTPARVAVVTGRYQEHPRAETIADNARFYGELCETACRQVKPDLIVLPEIALQWGVSGHAVELARPAPSADTDPFAKIAVRHKTRIVLGMLERDGDAVHNSALLIGPDGNIDGRYRKVHLAANSEWESGILPGDSFPVFATEVGRIGCNICMDSSAAESSRMVGLGGADFLVLPIMGDLRASRWTPGSPLFNESRWLAIMRTRALDNQLCMVVARNNAHGSCIIDRKGDVLAWNEGDSEFIHAEVPRTDGYRTWHGGCFRSVTWVQRRPHLYGRYADEACFGGLR